MKTRAIFTLGISVLVLGGAMAGYAGEGFTAFAGTKDPGKVAAHAFDTARKDLAKGRTDAAIASAELAVGSDPAMAAYRVLLGQAYLKAGRFVSAREAFGDALTLEPGNGKAALHLALAEIATGDWTAARHTLDANASTIAVSDRGLAMALAGDPAAAVELLDDAARAPEADAKTRQNYALALALAGRWPEAKTVVAMDVAPDKVDARIMEWASFAKPKSASDQVAALLGVTPVVDGGQPVALALKGPDKNTGLAAAQPVDAYLPGAPVEPAAVTVADAPAATADVPLAAADIAPEPVVMAASVSNVSFAPRQEVVQAVPKRAVRYAPVKREIAPGAVQAGSKVSAVVDKPKPAVGTAAAKIPAKGSFFVQLGAFENAAVARDAWSRTVRSHAAFAGQSPSGMPVSTKAGTFYRLSVGGFARRDADALCAGYKANGGTCFVRAGAGDRVAAWVKPGVQVASR